MQAGATAEAVERAFLWSGEFAEPDLEAHFRESSWSETIERMQAIQLGVLLFSSWSFVDYYVFGFSWTFFVLLAGRLAAIAIARIPVAFYSAIENHRAFYVSVSCVQIHIIAVFLILVNAGGMSAADHALGAVIFVAAFYFGTPNRLVYNVAISAAATVAVLVAVSRYPDMTFPSLVPVAALLAIINLVGAQSVRVANRLRRNAFLTLMHQRELNEQLTREIAVRQEAQRAVRVTEESFQSIFLAAPLPLALIDPVTYRVMQANHAALELFGLRNDEALSVDARNFFADEDVRERLSAATNREPAQGPFELRLKGADGNIIWAHISAALIRFHGLPALLIGLQDVTARRKEAEALREARDQATAASRSKSEFLANMSHELRTPLNAIIGFSEALERELFGPVGNPRYREYAEDIHDSGVHLLNLINDILDLSKIEAGHFKLHEEETDLDTFVASACRIVRHRAQQARITIETSLPRPPVGLVADDRAMKQVLINLISNAVKFSNDGSVVRIEATVGPKGLRIAVIDRGIGIAEEDIPKALAPFTQIDGTLSRTHEGTGLGLPLAKHMTELHGGTLTIESKLREGTTVYVDLPASRIIRRSQIQVG
jgi:PAS domain S-box-containing protein